MTNINVLRSIFVLYKNEKIMKTYSIKNYNGNKTLIVNDLAAADVKSLYLMAISLDIPFAVKQEIGIQIWGLAVVASYLGINDSSKLTN